MTGGGRGVGAIGRRDDQGRCQALGPVIADLTKLGYQVACTEWNWNGFGFHRLREHPGEHRLAAGLSSASFLNGLIRQGGDVRLATQSMLIGTTWGISAILVEDGRAPYRMPTGLVTSLYARCHGTWRLDTEVIGSPIVDQPFGIGWNQATRIATIDAVASEDERYVYLHVVNNDPHRPACLHVDASAAQASGSVALQRLVADRSGRDAAMIEFEQVTTVQGQLSIQLPPASVSVVRMDRPPAR